ncbi:MAG: Ig-like domain-containing protein [Lachnospiraceae bacterium]|nr:Ig-like domain-containing protein [Lachnospiraceae bacterium]
MKKWMICILVLLTPWLLSAPRVSAAQVTVVGAGYRSDYAFQLLELTNQEREKAGLEKLTMNQELMNAAMQRAAETYILFSHTRPNGKSCFTVHSSSHGENLVCCSINTGTPKKLMSLWMGSEGHKANILNARYQSVAIACCQLGNMVSAVQLFSWNSPENAAAQTISVRKNMKVQVIGKYMNLTFGNVGSLNLTSRTKPSQKLSVYHLDKEVFDLSAYDPADQTFWNYVNPVPLLASDFVWSSRNTSVARVSSDGTVTYAGEGTTTVTATLPGTGAKVSITVKCVKQPPFTVTLKKSVYTYNGKARKPAVIVKANGKKIASKYYKVTYKSNKNVGIATVTVTGKGAYKNYYGKATFKIKLKKAVIKSLASGKTKTMTIRWKKDNQAQYYQIQYAASAGFKTGVVTLDHISGTGKQIKGLVSGKKYYVRVRAVRQVGTELWYGAWSKTKSVKVK